MGTSPLYEAAGKGHIGIVEILLDAGADIITKNYISDWTALEVAESNKHTDIVKILSERQAKINVELQKELYDRDIGKVKSALAKGAEIETKHIDISKEKKLQDIETLLSETKTSRQRRSQYSS